MWRLLIVTCAALNIFFVPHSHIDVGWVRTVDDYYTMHAFPIISNILILLSEDPSRRFVWSEAIFLQRFLEENPEKIPVFKEYLKEGRLEIVGGGWVMNDEALVDFEGLIRQMTAGHNFFHKVLDVEHIKVAWQLDPFGHSSLTPAVFEKMGFEQMVMARISGNYRV